VVRRTTTLAIRARSFSHRNLVSRTRSPDLDGGGVVTDEWHIRIDQRYLHNEAGAGARAKERELAGEKRTARRLFEQVFDPRTDDRGWRRGEVVLEVADHDDSIAARLRASRRALGSR
jgi:hypothetical protein